MSSVTGFKQQCPSCGGQITIKNPDLVGKKVDCPKCKTRFVVEEPGHDEDISEPVDTRPADKSGRKGKSAAKKTKPAQPDAAPEGKKGIKKQYILAGVAVGVVAIVGLVILFTVGGGDKTKTRTTGGGSPVAGSGGPPVQPETPEVRMGGLVDKAVADNAGKAEADVLMHALSGDNAEDRNAGVLKLKEKCLAGIGKAFELVELAAKSEKAELKELAQKTQKEVQQELAKRDEGLRGDPTNMLPNNTQVVLSIPIKEFADSSFGTAVLRTIGAFRAADFEVRVGIPLSNIDRFVISGNREHGQSLGIVRTFDPMDWDSVKRALHLPDAPAQTIKGKSYFVGKVDFLTEFVENFIPVGGLREKAGVHKKDDRTLVYGDLKTIEAFLNSPPGFQVEAVVGPKMGFTGFVPPPPESEEGEKPGDKPPEAKPADSAPAAPPQTPTYIGIPGRPDLKAFLTIKPALRRLIERADFKKGGALVLFAADTAKESPALLVPYLNRLKPPQAAQVQMVAMALSQVDQLTLTTALMCRSKEVAPPIEAELKRILEEAAKGELKDALGFEFLGPWSEPVGEPIAGAPVRPGPMTTGGSGTGDTMAMYKAMMSRQMTGPRTGTIGGPQSGFPRSPDQETGSPDGATGPTGAPQGYPPSLPGDPNAPPPEPLEGSSIEFFRQDEFITVLMTVIDDTKSFGDVVVAPLVLRRRGEMDMRSGRFGLDTLSDAVRAAAREAYARGTLDRPPSAERRYRPWPPDQRVSWMRELLPFLGDDRYRAVYDGIDPGLSWRDPKNARAGSVLVPHFLHPQGGRYYTRVRGVDWQQAVTHFVGMSGVGPDSPYYDINDPRAGIFGYNRRTRKENVKDGLSNTIVMIQTDPALVGPWIAGGGATIRGTSETGADVGEVGGFSSPPLGGKQGVYIIMADGSVRFLTKGVSPEVFKALSTMAGGDNPGEIDKIAPKVDFPGRKPADTPKPRDEPRPEAKPKTEVKPAEAKPADKPADKVKPEK